jgi:hypothetical protein
VLEIHIYQNLFLFLETWMKTLVPVINDLKHFDPCVLLRILSISIYIHLFPCSHLSSQTQSWLWGSLTFWSLTMETSCRWNHTKVARKWWMFIFLFSWCKINIHYLKTTTIHLKINNLWIQKNPPSKWHVMYGDHVYLDIY